MPTAEVPSVSSWKCKFRYLDLLSPGAHKPAVAVVWPQCCWQTTWTEQGL